VQQTTEVVAIILAALTLQEPSRVPVILDTPEMDSLVPRVRIVGGVGGLNPPVILSTPQLMFLEVPQGVGHNPPTMTNVNKCMG